jgi:hypothetical protein
MILVSTAAFRPFMSSGSSPASVGRRRIPRWAISTAWSLLALLGAAYLGYTVTVTFGAVKGVEFCPQTFEQRSYSFYELPLVGIMITAKVHEDLTTAAETALASQKFITPPAGGQQDWHIVIGTRGTRLRRKGDASLLLEYLDAKDGQNHHRWIKWSEDHTQLAKIFWPAVQRLAVHELYVFVPELFELAKTMDDPIQLQQQLDHEVALRLLFLARRLQDRADHTAAIKLLDEAVPLDSSNQEIQRARETSRVVAQGPSTRSTTAAAP